jgi:hypothetical protein
MENESTVWAYQVIHHLVDAGAFNGPSDESEPFYRIAVSASGVDERRFSVGWGMAAYGRLYELAHAVQFDHNQMDYLLLRLHRALTSGSSGRGHSLRERRDRE